MRIDRVPVGKLVARAYSVPTDAPEADGTFTWDRTTLVTVELCGGGRRGLGYTYADATAVGLAVARRCSNVITHARLTTRGQAIRGIFILFRNVVCDTASHPV